MQQALIIIGDGKAGKTSLARYFQYKTNPLTDEPDRTINWEESEIPIPAPDGNDVIRLACFDLGGQFVYQLSQAVVLTPSAMYVFAIPVLHQDTDHGNDNNDDDSENIARKLIDEDTIQRFLVMLQASAPGALVQIVLTKADKKAVPTEQIREALRARVKELVDKYMKQLKDNYRRYYSSHQFLKIEDEIMITSVEDASQGNLLAKIISKLFSSKSHHMQYATCPADAMQGSARKDMFRKIYGFYLANPRKLCMIGQKIPFVWFYYIVFLGILSTHGIVDGLAEMLLQEIKDQLRDQSNNATESSNHCSLPFFSSCAQGQNARTGQGPASKNALDTSNLSSGNNSTSAKNLYLKKSDVSMAWKSCCEHEVFKNQENDEDAITLVQDVEEDVQNLLVSQGDILIQGGFLFPRPKYLM